MLGRMLQQAFTFVTERGKFLGRQALCIIQDRLLNRLVVFAMSFHARQHAKDYAFTNSQPFYVQLGVFRSS